jgi:pSer/pThr/pTyr-binding forkhead associated (FHA) protein
MKRKPVIIVQLVHMQGPLKGEIQEFSESEISTGRNPSCHVCFPAKLTIMSREHASIVREGNRFKLVDHSVNGTLVNGKPVKEVYLKDGDVIDFAQGGPKVSFLTQVSEGVAESVSTEEAPPKPRSVIASEQELRSTAEQETPVAPPDPPAVPLKSRVASPEPPAPLPEQERGVEAAVEERQAPVVIQYGPTLQSFKTVPVTIGKSPNADFVLDHGSVLDRHAQIFFYQNEYWARDLTGQNKVLVNHKPIDVQAPLAADDELALSSEGPFFRFLGGGRLAEIEQPSPEEAEESGIDLREEQPPREDVVKEKAAQKAMSILKKFLDR